MGNFDGLNNPATQPPTPNDGAQPSNELLFKAVQHQNKFEALHSRFSEKDFVSENRFWRFAALVTSWLINAISISGAFYGAFALFSYFGAGEQVSGVVSVALLALIELARRKAADSIWDKYFRFKKLAAGFVVLNLVLLVVSSTSSGYGIYHAITENAEPAPTLSDSTLTKMEGELAALRSDTETAKRIKWEGTVTENAQRTIKNNSKAIANLTEKINDRRERLTGKQDATETSHGEQVRQAAFIAVAVFLFLEILFQCCMAFMSYFDWRHYVLKLEQGQASIAATTPPANLTISPDEMRRLIANTKTGGMYPLNIVHPSLAAYLRPVGTAQQSGATLPPISGVNTLDNSATEPQSEAQTKGETQGANGRQIVSVPTDIYIEHKNRTTGKKQKMNITDVRRNLSANLSRLRKAKDTATIAAVGEQVAYWRAKENELIEKHQALERVG